jgi:hypothetical protein
LPTTVTFAGPAFSRSFRNSSPVAGTTSFAVAPGASG